MASKGVWSKVFSNFIASIRPRQFKGNLMGEDHFNTKYYEIPADPRGGKRRPSRWFVPHAKDDFQQEIPAEWEAWLRGRRKDVPTIEEVLRSAGISQMKKENAKKVALENPFVKEDDDDNSRTVSKVPFPTYNEYDMPPDPKQKS